MDLSYNLSEKLNGYLTKIEKLRIEIMLTPLSPKNELRFRWDVNLERTVWSLSLIDNPISKPDAAKILSNISGSRKRFTNFQKDVINQKRAFLYIRENWLGSKNPITMDTIKKLYEISCRETGGPMSGLTEYSEKRINSLLNYLQKGQDHPIIQAGIAQIQIINITPFDNCNGRIARFLSYLFLYKSGYDMRDMVSFEEIFRRDMITFKRVTDLSRTQGSSTLWLEYFAFCIMTSLEKTIDMVKNLKFKDELPASFWKLNNRQKQIVEYLDNPELSITNKEVQKVHGVSQITASRDLAKLTSLGLLLAHGKGRSVYYIKG